MKNKQLKTISKPANKPGYPRLQQLNKYELDSIVGGYDFGGCSAGDLHYGNYGCVKQIG